VTGSVGKEDDTQTGKFFLNYSFNGDFDEQLSDICSFSPINSNSYIRGASYQYDVEMNSQSSDTDFSLTSDELSDSGSETASSALHALSSPWRASWTLSNSKTSYEEYLSKLQARGAVDNPVRPLMRKRIFHQDGSSLRSANRLKKGFPSRSSFSKKMLTPRENSIRHQNVASNSHLVAVGRQTGSISASFQAPEHTTSSTQEVPRRSLKKGPSRQRSWSSSNFDNLSSTEECGMRQRHATSTQSLMTPAALSKQLSLTKLSQTGQPSSPAPILIKRASESKLSQIGRPSSPAPNLIKRASESKLSQIGRPSSPAPILIKRAQINPVGYSKGPSFGSLNLSHRPASPSLGSSMVFDSPIAGYSNQFDTDKLDSSSFQFSPLQLNLTMAHLSASMGSMR
jgi:hypothetical protein